MCSFTRGFLRRRIDFLIRSKPVSFCFTTCIWAVICSKTSLAMSHYFPLSQISSGKNSEIVWTQGKWCRINGNLLFRCCQQQSGPGLLPRHTNLSFSSTIQEMGAFKRKPFWLCKRRSVLKQTKNILRKQGISHQLEMGRNNKQDWW